MSSTPPFSDLTFTVKMTVLGDLGVVTDFTRRWIPEKHVLRSNYKIFGVTNSFDIRCEESDMIRANEKSDSKLMKRLKRWFENRAIGAKLLVNMAYGGQLTPLGFSSTGEEIKDTECLNLRFKHQGATFLVLTRIANRYDKISSYLSLYEKANKIITAYSDDILEMVKSRNIFHICFTEMLRDTVYITHLSFNRAATEPFNRAATEPFNLDIDGTLDREAPFLALYNAIKDLPSNRSVPEIPYTGLKINTPVYADPHIYFHIDSSIKEGVYRLRGLPPSTLIPVYTSYETWELRGEGELKMDLISEVESDSPFPWMRTAFEYGETDKRDNRFVFVSHKYETTGPAIKLYRMAVASALA